jgi:hypothetical protein
MSENADRVALAQLFAKIAFWTEQQTAQPLAGAAPDVQKAFDTASAMLGQLVEGMEDPWTGNAIYRIIRKSARYIVFLDQHLNVRWWWVLRPDMTVISGVQARIDELVHESAFLLEDKPGSRNPAAAGELGKFTAEAVNIRCVIGAAMALALNGGTAAECEKVLDEAEKYITVAKDQRCRPKFVLFFLMAVAAFGVAALFRYGYACTPLKKINTGDVSDWLEAAFAGSFGALISAVMRTTDLKLEPAARSAGLAVEAFARALIGAAAGILLDFAFHGGLLFQEALKQDFTNPVRLFLCVAAGISERILPTLVSKADDMVSKGKTTEPTPKAQGSEPHKPAVVAAPPDPKHEAVG